jgi:hypothetical protein
MASEKTLGEALKRASSGGGGSWDGEDRSIIAQSAPEEYYEFLKSARGKELRDAVKWCLKQGSFANADSKNKAIYRKTMEALSRIADESRLNKIRLSQRYEIDLEELPNY